MITRIVPGKRYWYLNLLVEAISVQKNPWMPQTVTFRYVHVDDRKEGGALAKHFRQMAEPAGGIKS